MTGGLGEGQSSGRRLSYSQYSTYADCSLRWKLEREHPDGMATWLATLAGDLLHRITEEWDRDPGTDYERLAAVPPAEEFGKRLADAEYAQFLDGCDVQTSGRRQDALTEMGGPNGKDGAWWMHYGPIFLARWARFVANSGWKIATGTDGQPMVEVPVEIATPAGNTVRGIVDRVMVDGNAVAIIDLKFGRAPSGPLQLWTYHAAMVQGGLYPGGDETTRIGAFWSPYSGRKRPPEGEHVGYLKTLTRLEGDSLPAQMAAMYDTVAAGMDAGIVFPNQGGMCRACPVAKHCWLRSGEASQPERGGLAGF